MTRYEEYLRSRHWRRRRKAFASTHPMVCPCGEAQHLQLHHRSYDRLGAELDRDLMWLCQRCHSLVEQLIDEGQLDRACEGFFRRDRSVRVGSDTGFVPAHLRGATRDARGRLLVADPDWNRARALPRKTRP